MDGVEQVIAVAFGGACLFVLCGLVLVFWCILAIVSMDRRRR